MWGGGGVHEGHIWPTAYYEDTLNCVNLIEEQICLVTDHWSGIFRQSFFKPALIIGVVSLDSLSLNLH